MRHLFYQPGIPDGVHRLDPEESRHATKAFRLHEGDPLSLTDGKGSFYDARILDVDASKCTFQILNKRLSPAKKFRIHIAIAATKNSDRMEWFVEKTTEIGVHQISFILCTHSERKSINMERIEKIAVSAMKQSQQAWLPVLSPFVPFKTIVQATPGQRLIAFVDPVNSRHLQSVAYPNGEYVVLIGPEGDFSKDELSLALENGFQKVSLGDTRLRTETAGVAACHILNLINQPPGT